MEVSEPVSMNWCPRPPEPWETSNWNNHPIHKEIQIVKTLQTSKKKQEIRCNEREHLAVVLLVPCFLLVVFVRTTKCRVMRWTILVAKKEDNMLGDCDGFCRLRHTYQHQGGTTSRHRD